MPADKSTIKFINRLRASVLVLTAALITTGAFAHQQTRGSHPESRLAPELRVTSSPEKKGESYSRQEVMELEWELYKARANAGE